MSASRLRARSEVSLPSRSEEAAVTLRLPTGEVTVLLGEQIVRRRLMDKLDDSSAREET